MLLAAPADRTPNAPVTLVEYICVDPAGQPVDVTLEYSMDGSAFAPAAADPSDPRHEPLHGLTASASGMTHGFVWNWQADAGSAPTGILRLRGIASNSSGAGDPGFSGFFTIDAPVPPPSGPPALSVSLTQPSANLSGDDFLLEYSVSDPGSSPVDVTVEYSSQGGSFAPATPKTDDARQSGVTAVPTSPEGSASTFVWDWVADIGAASASQVALRVTVTTPSGTTAQSQTTPVDIQVTVHDYQLTVAKGGQIDATPSLHLPADSIQLVLTDHGTPVPNAPVSVHVLEGGGGFPKPRPPLPDQLRSRNSFKTGGAGEISIPEFVLGSEPGPNRLLIQTENAQKIVTVMGSYTNTRWVPVDPASGNVDSVVAQDVTLIAKLEDTGFPTAPLEPVPIAIEMQSGGGWIHQLEGFGRSVILETGTSYITSPFTAVPNSVMFTILVSAQEETGSLTLSVRDAPDAPVLTITVATRKLRLVTLRWSPVAPDEDIEDTSTGWLGWLSRWVITDDATVTSADQNTPRWYTYDITAEQKSGQSELHPDDHAGWSGDTTLAVRPLSAGAFQWDLYLVDFPDSPTRTLGGLGVDRLEGSYTLLSPPLFVERVGGSTRDENCGVELELVSGDVQHVGPNASSAAPFEFNVITTELQPANQRRLAAVWIRAKVRTAPGSSAIDDPAYPDTTPGTVGTAPGAGMDELEISIPPAPGSTPVSLWLNMPDVNYENFVEITARVTIEEVDSNGNWIPSDSDANILARAIFFAPRLSIRKKNGSDFVAPGEEGLVPQSLVDPAGTPLTPNPDFEYYVELRAQDYGATVQAEITGGQTLELTKIKTTPAYTLYRSKPIVLYLENPQAFGSYQFSNLPTTHEYFELRQPRWFYANGKDAIANNTKNLNYWSAVRPFTFMNVLPVGRDVTLTPFVPAPRIDLGSLLARDPKHTVVVENSQAKVQVTGAVYDTLADITPGGAASISTMTVNGVAYPISPSGQVPTVLRPAAWRGTFDIKVPLQPGLQVLEFGVENALGAKTTLKVLADLADDRNDYRTPDAAHLTADIRLLSSPKRDNDRGLAGLHYRMPATRQTSSTPPTVQVQVRSIARAPGTQQEDSVDLTLEAVGGLEPNFAGVVLAVPPSVDAQKLAALKGAGAPIVKHTPGTRLHVVGQALPHLAGTIALQTFAASAALKIRVLVKTGPATYEERTSLRVGNEFTVEAMPQSVFHAPVELTLVLCDSSGSALDGDARFLTIQAQAAASGPGWFRMQSFTDSSGKTIAASTVILSTDHGTIDASFTGGTLRMNGHGSLRISQYRFDRIESIWPVATEPIRREISSTPVPAEPHHVHGARDGALQTVVAGTGELVLEETDARLLGRNLSASFERVYHSFIGYEGPLGLGWNHGYNSWLRKPDPDHFRWVSHTGLTYEFVHNTTTGNFDSPRGLCGRLSVSGNFMCVLEWAGGARHVYIRSCAEDDVWQLIAVEDRIRNRLSATRDQAGTLTGIRDPLNQRLLLQYTDQGTVATVGDETGRAWRYAYHDAASADGPDGSLKSMQQPAVTASHNAYPGKERSYDYYKDPAVPATHGKLKALQDPEGSKSRSGTPLPAFIGITYDGDGRVNNQTYGNGTYGFVYALPLVSVTNRRNVTAEYLFPTAPGQAHLATLPLETHNPNLAGGKDTFKFENNDDGFLTRWESPLTTVTEYHYEQVSTDPRDRHNLVELKHFPRGASPDRLINTVGLADFTQTPPDVTPPMLRWGWSYESKYQQIKTMDDALGLSTLYTYDYETADADTKDGNIFSIEPSPLRTGLHPFAQGDRLTRWWFNNYGQPIKVANPAGVVTVYDYYPLAHPRGGLNAPVVSGPTAATSRLARVTTDTSDPQIPRSSLILPPETATEKWSYDAWGHDREISDRNGNVIVQTHNELGQLMERRRPDGLVEQFWFDVNNRPQKLSHVVRDVNVPAGTNPQTSHVVFREYEYYRCGTIKSETADSTGLALRTEYELDLEDNIWKVHTPSATRAQSPDTDNYVEFEFDPQNRVTKITHAPGRASRWEKQFTYDKEGLLTEILEANNIKTTYVYNSWGQRIEAVDGLGNRKIQIYDAMGNPTYRAIVGSLDGEAGSQPQTLQESYLFLNEASKVVGLTTKVFRWTNQGGTWQQQAIDTGMVTETFEFEPALNLVAMVDGRNLRTELRYNGRGHVRSMANPQTGQSNTRYDGQGNLTDVLAPSPSGATIIVQSRAYDSANRLKTIQEAGRGAYEQRYDTTGNLRYVEDGLGNRIYHEYDGTGRRVKTTRELRANGRLRNPGAATDNPQERSQVLVVEHDQNDNVLSLKDEKGRSIITHTYGSRNERQTTTLPEDAFPSLQRPATGTNVYSYEYWENGRNRYLTTPDGVRLESVYDDAGRLSQRNVAAAPGVAAAPAIYGTTRQTFKYDGADRCVKGEDNNGSATQSIVTELQHDSLNQVWSDRQVQTFLAGDQNLTALATHRAIGELAVMTYPGTAGAIRYMYDPLGRPDSIYDNPTNTRLAHYTYNKNYLERRETGNQHATVVNHDGNGILQRYMQVSPLTGIAPPSPFPGLQAGEKLVRGVELWVEERGLPDVVKDLKENKATLMFYDSLSRILQESEGVDPSNLQSLPEAGVFQQYDARGNSVDFIAGGIDRKSSSTGEYILKDPTDSFHIYNNANQLGRTVDGYLDANRKYHQDAIDILWDTRGNMVQDHRYQYRYDAFNRLVEVVDRGNNQTVQRNHFDVFDRRILRGNTRFLYWKDKLLEERPTNGALIHRYFHDQDGVFMIELDFSTFGGGSDRYSLHRDRAGSTEFLTNAAGDIVEQYKYHPLFGTPTCLDANGDPKVVSLGNCWLFQGMYYDQSTGLFQAGARFYHPRFKIMLQRDPDGIDFDSNAYSFARNNAKAFADPSGRYWQLILLALLDEIAEAALVGALIGVAIVTLDSVADYLDGNRKSPIPGLDEVVDGALQGMVLGPVMRFAPYVGYGLAVQGAISSGVQFGRGNYVRGSLHAVLALWAGLGTYRGYAARRVAENQAEIGPARGLTSEEAQLVSTSLEQAIRAIPDQATNFRVIRGGWRAIAEDLGLEVLEGGGKAARDAEGNHMAGSYQILDPLGRIRAEGIRASGGKRSDGLGRHFEDAIREEIGPLTRPGDTVILRGPYTYCNQCRAQHVLGNMAMERGIAIWYRGGEGTSDLFLSSGARAMFRPDGSVQWTHPRPLPDGTVVVRNYFRARTPNGRLVRPAPPRHRPTPNPRDWPLQ